MVDQCCLQMLLFLEVKELNAMIVKLVYLGSIFCCIPVVWYRKEEFRVKLGKMS